MKPSLALRCSAPHHATYIKFGHVVFEVSEQFVGHPTENDTSTGRICLYDFTPGSPATVTWRDIEKDIMADEPASSISPQDVLQVHLECYDEYRGLVEAGYIEEDEQEAA